MTSREIFESWCKSTGHSTTPCSTDRELYWYAETSAAWNAWQAALAQQVAVPPGYALVPVETLLSIKGRVNTLATLSLKAERYSVGRAIKQDIADMLAAAQGVKP